MHTLFKGFLKEICPEEGLLALFEAIAIDAWENEFSELSRISIEAANELTTLKEERLEAMEMMKLSRNNPALYSSWEEVFNRKTEQINEATTTRNDHEWTEYKAEKVLAYCRHYMKHASELWEKADVEDQNRLQRLALPDGIPFDVLENKRTPKLSLVYEAIKNLEPVQNDVAERRGLTTLIPDP